MNKSVIIIQLLISSGLSNPIDTTTPSDVSVSKVNDSQIRQPPVPVAVNDAGDDGTVLKNVDTIISNSEIIKVNSIDKIVEDKPFFEDDDKRDSEAKAAETTNKAENRDIVSDSESETKVSPSTQSLHEEDKKAIETESVTSVMEDDSTDFLENPTESSIDSKTASKEESKSIKAELVKPSDESNDDWDVLDDLISTRRMMPDMDDSKKEKISAIIPGKVKPKTAVPQERGQSTTAQNEKVNDKKGNNDVEVIHLPNISNAPTKGPFYQPEGLPSYFVEPAKTKSKSDEDSSIYNIMSYPPETPTRRNFRPQKPDYIPIQFPIKTYTSPISKTPINKSAYILSKLFVASEEPIRYGRRMNKNSVGLNTPKFLNINLPKLASSCGVTRACALFTI